MLEIIRSLKHPLPKFDTVVHLGAGPDFDSDLYHVISAKSYVLVEADPVFAEALRNLAPNDKFQIIEGYVTSEPGIQILRRFTLRTLNGPFGFGLLQSTYPRAKEIQQISVSCLPIENLINKLQLDPKGIHALLFDLPGQEAGLLLNLAPDLLSIFECVLISGAGHPLMEGATLLSETLPILTQSHWTVIMDDYNTDQLRPFVLIQRDLRALLESRTNERDIKAKLANEIQEAFENLKNEIESAKESLAENQQKSLELGALLESRTNERDIKAKLANEIQEAFEGLKNERDRLKKIAADCAASKSKLDDQVAKQLEHQRQIDAQMVRAETQIELLKEFMLAKIG